MAKLLKWWHQYSMFITIGGYVFMCGMTYKGYTDAMAAMQQNFVNIETQHQQENADHRVTVLEQIAADNKDNFAEIRDMEKAIFLRINQIQDGRR